MVSPKKKQTLEKCLMKNHKSSQNVNIETNKYSNREFWRLVQKTIQNFIQGRTVNLTDWTVQDTDLYSPDFR